MEYKIDVEDMASAMFDDVISSVSRAKNYANKLELSINACKETSDHMAIVYLFAVLNDMPSEFKSDKSDILKQEARLYLELKAKNG